MRKDSRLVDGIMCELLFRIPVMAATHFPDGMIPRLKRLKLIKGKKVFARTPLRLEKPMKVIRPRDPMPDFEALAYAGEKRLEEPREYDIYFASERAEGIYGERTIKYRPLQIGHDIQLASVYEAMKRNDYYRASMLIPEHRLGKIAKLLPKVPDAIIPGRGELLDITAIEIIGDYPASRIRELVEKLHGWNWTVELW